jgi:TatD DNase family protein
MRLTDTHCHLDLEKFDADRQAVIERALAIGVTRILVPGITLKSSHTIVHLVGSHPNLFAAVGVHPDEALTWDPQTVPALRELAADLKVVAIGEIGLDYYWDTAPHDYQQMVLKAQLDLAAELQLPVLIHLREKEDAPDGDCARDLIRILEEWAGRLRAEGNPLAGAPGVLHSFSGSVQTAQKAIDLNFYIGVTGPLTFKNAEKRQEIIASLPLERLLIETDAPFLAPLPKRGIRNEPAFVIYIAEKIATLHSITPDQAAELTTSNADRLFGWGG